MQLLPITESAEENTAFIQNPLCSGTLSMTLDFYKRAGFAPPWICYYASRGGQLVGSAGFKGAPVNGMVEIAYGSFEPFRRQGVGTDICKALVALALKTNPAITITARTLPENNFSTRILEKNGFVFAGAVNDPEDGMVWEWRYEGALFERTGTIHQTGSNAG